METQEFIAALRRQKRSWQSGLMLAAAMRLAGFVATTLVVYGVFDFFLAFDQRVCLILDLILLAVFAGFLAAWIRHIVRLTDGDMAGRADRLLHSRRRLILSALEIEAWLGRERGRLPELQVYLAHQSIEKASAEMARLKLSDAFPFPELGRRARTLVLQAIVAGLLACANPAATRTIASRILFPLRDTPPYSLYTFTVSPDTPRVIYGGTVDVSAEITGAPVKSEVWFVTRYRAQTHRTACFQESSLRFAQRLEKVVSPVEFCFAAGKARSRWHKVDLLLRPEIAHAHVTIAPPGYTRLPVRQFPVGKEEVAGYRQSRVELFLSSNRPLTDGLLTIRPASGLDADRSVTGVRCAPSMVSFSWLLQEDAELDVTIRDIRGTRNSTPFRIQQKVLPDHPPEAMITDPPAFSLATPTVALPLAGYVSDDLSVRKVDLVRTVVGYRDRMSPLGPAEPLPRFDFTRTLDLKALGTRPGEMLEFYLEAVDSNPAMTGVTASDIVRVQIISEEEYATMLRARATLDDFLQRYRLMQADLHRLTEALENLKKPGTEAELGKALKDARDANRRLADFAGKLASDFPIFDSEKELTETVGEVLKTLKDQGFELEQMKAPYTGAARMAETMLAELGAAGKAIDAQAATAEEIALIGRLMECAARFKDIVRWQSELVRRLNRFDREAAARDLSLLVSLGRRQEELRAELVTLVSDLQDRAGQLPADYDALRFSALKFAERVGTYEIPDLMKKAVNASENQDGKLTLHFATLALEKLKELISNCSGTEFGGLCQGQSQITFSVSDQIKSTLQQMLSAIMSRASGTGKGRIGLAGGGMIGGDQSDGYWSDGYSPLNVPVLGPARTAFPGGQEAGVTGPGSGRGRGPAAGARPAGAEALDRRGATEVKSESLPMEQVPEKYRDAIKRYFSHEENSK